MPSSNAMVELPADILTLVAAELIGDNQSLSSLSRTCQALHSLCLPLLLHTVDLSSHNLGRQPQHEDQQFPPMFVVIKADYNNKYRPRDNLVSRQRAFLRLLTSRPELALYVKDLTWTLIWTDFGEAFIADIDRQTWTVFSRLTNVQRLDLASLNEHWKEPYIRQNPARLFPAVTELRLLGWMHRGLVKAIIDTLDVNRFCSLKLDCLQDEGALQGGKPISLDVTQDQAPNDHNNGEDCTLPDEVILRQEVGEAIIFPGPMWLPIRILRGKNLTSLASIDISMPPLDPYIDLRIYYTMFQEICKLIISARDCLEHLTLRIGEWPCIDCGGSEPAGCNRNHFAREHGFEFDLITTFLHELLPTLTSNTFTRLTAVDLEGFRVIELGTSRLPLPPDPSIVWDMIDACPFTEVTSLRKPNVDHRRSFQGYDYAMTKEETAEVTRMLDWS